MQTRLELKGGLELSKALAAIETEVATKVGEFAVRTTARDLLNALNEAAPYDPDEGGMSAKYGHLNQNLRIRKIRPRKADRVIYRVGIGNAWWGALVEFGTAKAAPHPWFRPTWARMEGPLSQSIVTHTRAGLDRAAKKAARLARKKG